MERADTSAYPWREGRYCCPACGDWVAADTTSELTLDGVTVSVCAPCGVTLDRPLPSETGGEADG